MYYKLIVLSSIWLCEAWREVTESFSKTVFGKDVQDRLIQLADIQCNVTAFPIVNEANEHLKEHLSYVDCMITDFRSNGCTVHVHVFARSDAMATICFIDQFCAVLFKSGGYLRAQLI